MLFTGSYVYQYPSLKFSLIGFARHIKSSPFSNLPLILYILKQRDMERCGMTMSHILNAKFPSCCQLTQFHFEYIDELFCQMTNISFFCCFSFAVQVISCQMIHDTQAITEVNYTKLSLISYHCPLIFTKVK